MLRRNLTNSSVMLIFALVLGGQLGACERKDSAKTTHETMPALTDAPAELDIGADQCIYCSMHISDSRCAAAFLVEHDGAREHVLFDDIGCMLDYAFDHRKDDVPPIRGFVRDYANDQWVASDTALYLFADPKKLITPMRSGIVAFHAESDAKDKQSEVGGEILDYPHLVAARRDFMEARYGKPAESP